MATTILQGRDWGDDTHWTGNKPVTGDTALIREGLDQDIDQNPDQGGVDAALIRIHEQFTRPLFSSGAPLKIAATKFEHYGQGACYVAFSANGTDSFVTDDVEIACGGDNAQRVMTELDSESGDAGDVKRILLRRGTVKINTNLAWDNTDGQVIVGKIDSDNDVTLEIASGSDTLPRLSQGSGSVVSHRAITNAVVSGKSKLRQETATIATLDICAGAHVVYNHTALTTVRVFPGGVLDLLGNTVEKTVTTIWAFPGSTVLYDAALHTFTNNNDYRRFRP